MKNIVIFDFDGVVIDSTDIQRKAYYDSIKTLKLTSTPPFEDFQLLSGSSLKNIFLELNLPLDMIPIYREISRKHITMIKTIPGMEKLLISLKSYGFFCAICTGKDRERTLEILSSLNLSLYFDIIVCSDDVEHPKPSADSINLIMKNLNITNKNQAIMLGDAPSDILCAHNAKIDSIAVSWGQNNIAMLEKYKPRYTVTTINELYKCLYDFFSESNLASEDAKFETI